MTSRDLLILAWRGLSRRPVRTLLTTLGLSVAVAGMVVFLSLGEGIKQVFTGQFRSVGPDVQLTLDGAQSGLLPPPNLPESVVEKVRVAAAPYGATQVTPVVTFLKQSLDPTQSAVYYGLPAAQGIGALFEGLQTTRGRMLDVSDEGREVAVLGQSAARNAGADVGGTVDVMGTPVRVIGVLEGGHGLNDSFTFLPLTTLQRLSGAARPASRSVTDAARIGISVVSLIVGGLAVANTVAMGVFERVREFGTLRAIGARPAFVRTLVLTESLLLAVVAGVIGLLIGLAGNAGVNAYTRNLANIDAAALTPTLAAVALGVSLILGLVAALIPARTAARLPVVEALSRT